MLFRYSARAGDVFGQLVQADDLESSVSIKFDDAISFVNVHETADHATVSTRDPLHLRRYTHDIEHTGGGASYLVMLAGARGFNVSTWDIHFLSSVREIHTGHPTQDGPDHTHLPSKLLVLHVHVRTSKTADSAVIHVKLT